MKHVWHAFTLAAVVGVALAPTRPALAQASAAASTEARARCASSRRTTPKDEAGPSGRPARCIHGAA